MAVISLLMVAPTPARLSISATMDLGVYFLLRLSSPNLLHQDIMLVN